LAAYALLEDGRAVLLRFGLRPCRSTNTWVAFLRDLIARGLGAPFLIIPDGSHGFAKGARKVFLGVRRQRCQVHKMRNILGTLSRHAQRELKPLLQQVFPAPDYRTAFRRGRALIARFRIRFPSVMECLEKNLEKCVTALLFPVEHRRRIRPPTSRSGRSQRAAAGRR
jgi:transposase-like protein